MTRPLVLLVALILLAAAGAGAAAGEAADTAAAAPPWFVAVETQEKPVDSSIAEVKPTCCAWDYWQEGGKSSRSEVVRNLGLLAVAIIGVGFGIWRAWTAHRQAQASLRQAGTAEQGQITERFSRAAEHLGHDKVAVRIGGLYALKRIAEDSLERDHLAVMDVLTNFIRQPPYADMQQAAARRGRKLRAFRTNSAEENADADQIDRAGQTADAAAQPLEPYLIDCPDIVAAIGIIHDRSDDQKAVEVKRGYRLSLSRASLSYLRLPEVDLQYFDLAGANLTGTELTRAKLLDAILVRAKLLDANLTGADISGAKLSDANLTGATLRGAKLMVADFTDADLTGADLMFANLTDADLTGAYLVDANLTDADLTDADLTGVTLMVAHLMVADLTGADFSDADLTGVDLSGARNLTQDQLDSACISRGGEPPALPEGLRPPHRDCGRSIR